MATKDEAYSECLRLLEKAVLRVCPAWLSSDREDLVQKAMLRVMNISRRRGEAPAFTYAYLRKVATSVLIDEIRRRRRRQEEQLPDTDAPRQLPSPTVNPERESVSKQLGRAIQRCLESLIPDRKRVMTLCLVGHPNREIAEILGFNAKKAENLVTRARADMRQCLESAGFAP